MNFKAVTNNNIFLHIDICRHTGVNESSRDRRIEILSISWKNLLSWPKMTYMLRTKTAIFTCRFRVIERNWQIFCVESSITMNALAFLVDGQWTYKYFSIIPFIVVAVYFTFFPANIARWNVMCHNDLSTRKKEWKVSIFVLFC